LEIHIRDALTQWWEPKAQQHLERLGFKNRQFNIFTMERKLIDTVENWWATHLSFAEASTVTALHDLSLT
jgi:hypothetical protein